MKITFHYKFISKNTNYSEEPVFYWKLKDFFLFHINNKNERYLYFDYNFIYFLNKINKKHYFLNKINKKHFYLISG